jgi:hypothetical protein
LKPGAFKQWVHWIRLVTAPRRRVVVLPYRDTRVCSGVIGDGGEDNIRREHRHLFAHTGTGVKHEGEEPHGAAVGLPLLLGFRRDAIGGSHGGDASEETARGAGVPDSCSDDLQRGATHVVALQVAFERQTLKPVFSLHRI